MGSLLEDTTVLGLLSDDDKGGGNGGWTSMLPFLLAGQGMGSSQGQAGNPLQDLLAKLLPGIFGYMKGGIPGGLMGLFGGGMFGGGQQQRDPNQDIIDQLTAELDGTPARPLPSGLAEANLMSPEAGQSWMGTIPEQMRPGVTVNLEQNAAINRINRQRFADWQNLMRGAYGEAMGGFEQMRGMYA